MKIRHMNVTYPVGPMPKTLKELKEYVAESFLLQPGNIKLYYKSKEFTKDQDLKNYQKDDEILLKKTIYRNGEVPGVKLVIKSYYDNAEIFYFKKNVKFEDYLKSFSYDYVNNIKFVSYPNGDEFLYDMTIEQDTILYMVNKDKNVLFVKSENSEILCLSYDENTTLQNLEDQVEAKTGYFKGKKLVSYPSGKEIENIALMEEDTILYVADKSKEVLFVKLRNSEILCLSYDENTNIHNLKEQIQAITMQSVDRLYLANESGNILEDALLVSGISPLPLSTNNSQVIQLSLYDSIDIEGKVLSEAIRSITLSVGSTILTGLGLFLYEKLSSSLHLPNIIPSAKICAGISLVVGFVCYNVTRNNQIGISQI